MAVLIVQNAKVIRQGLSDSQAACLSEQAVSHGQI
ncbi:hypothetical protein SAMN05443635_10566 [Roseobacter denitrificans OCh 114]|nr:hypothetical protein SAMN05443635_10566 [Roseobacter denitrificans OCh 114]